MSLLFSNKLMDTRIKISKSTYKKDHILVFLLNFDLIFTSTENVNSHIRDDGSNSNARIAGVAIFFMGCTSRTKNLQNYFSEYTLRAKPSY